MHERWLKRSKEAIRETYVHVCDPCAGCTGNTLAIGKMTESKPIFGNGTRFIEEKKAGHKAGARLLHGGT